jgi:hypothetical protein
MRLAGATALFAAIGCLVAGPTRAQDGRQGLLRDLVKTEDGQFVYDDLAICRLELPGKQSPKFQVRSRATAPEKGLISRDRFVALVTTVENEIALAWAESGAVVRPSVAMRALHCDPLEQPIGQVDIEITTTLTPEGIQFEYKDTAKNKVERSSNTWKHMVGSE